MQSRQTTDTVVMVRPKRFAGNPQTRATNHFQSVLAEDANTLALKAAAEFDGAVSVLRHAGVEVLVLDDTVAPPTPDAVFPNNWFTTHEDGRVAIYPMAPVNRRWERRPRALAALFNDHGFKYSEWVDFTNHEANLNYLEGTGAMVFDRDQRVAYVARSHRADRLPLQLFADTFGFEIEAFAALDRAGRAIYHTNVMMGIGTHFAAAAFEALVNRDERDRVRQSLLDSGRELIELSHNEIESFAGNFLELRTHDGRVIIALSAQAYAALEPKNRDQLATHGELLPIPIETIETLAGGSIRCMLAEVFLPRT